MEISEIYKAFDAIGCLSFTTIDENLCPQSRIAHLRGYDQDGIYFMTMHTKSFYRQLKKNPHIALCGLCADTRVDHDGDGMPVFDDGYAMRLSGKVKEVSMAEIKAKNNPIFDLCIKDQEKYPAMVVFCIHQGQGDIFDYDFTTKTRENKLQRKYFAFLGGEIQCRGLKIHQDQCISCGVCKGSCSFLAIEEKDNRYTIDPYRCDECGDCLIHCPVSAITAQHL